MSRTITLSAIAAFLIAMLLIPALLLGVPGVGDSVDASHSEKSDKSEKSEKSGKLTASVLTGKQLTFLPDHYDERAGGAFVSPGSSGIFDDGADTLLSGRISGLGKVTVESSAAWDWGTWTPGHPNAMVYVVPITMPTDHQHAGCTVTGGGSHTFTASVTITKKNGDTITADIIGGSNTERALFPGSPGHDPICDDLVPPGSSTGTPAYDGLHAETENTVVLVFVITGGTGKLDGSTGDGVLTYTYNTNEPHEFLEAGILRKLIKP